MVGGGVLHVSVRVCVFVHVRACVTKPEGIVPGETEHVAAAFMLPPFGFFFFLFLLFLLLLLLLLLLFLLRLLLFFLFLLLLSFLSSFFFRTDEDL